MRAVRINSFGADDELFRNLVIREALGYELQDLALTLG
jgi:hypothetical protein